MIPSVPPPKLPAWIFYATDVMLLATAGFIAARAPQPLPNSAIFSIVACVITGAILATIPRLLAYEREKNAALDDRQTALEGLSQTVANSAEQISAAAGGLHTLVDLTHKNLRHADQLPHKLQEKIAEFQAQLANATDGEKEELEKELAALRSSESERLESISDRIAKSVAEFARLQTALQKQFAAFSEALAKAPAAPVASGNTEAAALPPPPLPLPAPALADAPVVATAAVEAKTEGASPPPKRPRVTRREEVVAPAAAPSTPAPAHTATALEESSSVKVQEISPASGNTPSPFPEPFVAVAVTTPTSVVAPDTTASAAPSKPARKRVEKKSAEASSEHLMDLDLDAAPAASSSTATFSNTATAVLAPPVSPAMASAATDGATRLLVTAYIGIGNRLFIRGDGPGLSWEKGLPLQFVSIGKWRWETAEATGTVKFKLYKNDELECASIGLQSLPLGHQQELTAAF